MKLVLVAVNGFLKRGDVVFEDATSPVKALEPLPGNAEVAQKRLIGKDTSIRWMVYVDAEGRFIEERGKGLAFGDTEPPERLY